VYPVNPRYAEILGTKCYPDIESIPGDFDLAIYFIPAKSLPDIIRACAKKGVKAIIIESAGFSEVGEGGPDVTEGIGRPRAEFRHTAVGAQLHGTSRRALAQRILVHVFG
jgi:acetyltransferase